MKFIKKAFYFYIQLCSLTNQSHDFDLISIQDLLPQRPDIEYIKCHEIEPFEYKPFPISQFPELQPNKGLLAETFILKIPNGQACSWHGWIKVDNYIVHDLISHLFSLNYQLRLLSQTSFTNIKKIKGKVAVITLMADTCFFHWIFNILGRLALLEIAGIEYDWLYVSYDKPYMKETLTLWGIDPAKIIQPLSKQNHYIQADELIVPSHVGIRAVQNNQYRLNWIPFDLYAKKWNISPEKFNTLYLYNSNNSIYDHTPPSYVSMHDYFFHTVPLCSLYPSEWFITFLQNKFLPLIQNKPYDFSKKIFISREKAYTRKIINEDEIFNIFKNLGFKKYILEDMSFLEQIALFNQADTVVAAHGSSLINLLFCKPNTAIIEIFQARSDC